MSIDAELNNSLRNRLTEMGTADVSDALDEAGYTCQILASKLASFGSDTFCGPAICIQGEMKTHTQALHDRNQYPSYEMTSMAQDGYVLVISTQGFSGGAVIGDRIADKLLEVGCLGVATDGYVRDSKELNRLRLPIKGAGAVPINDGKLWAITQRDIPVFLQAFDGGWIKVTPGDYILADLDGIVVIPQSAISFLSNVS